MRDDLKEELGKKPHPRRNRPGQRARQRVRAPYRWGVHCYALHNQHPFADSTTFIFYRSPRPSTAQRPNTSRTPNWTQTGVSECNRKKRLEKNGKPSMARRQAQSTRATSGQGRDPTGDGTAAVAAVPVAAGMPELALARVPTRAVRSSTPRGLPKNARRRWP